MSKASDDLLEIARRGCGEIERQPRQQGVEQRALICAQGVPLATAEKAAAYRGRVLVACRHGWCLYPSGEREAKRRDLQAAIA